MFISCCSLTGITPGRIEYWSDGSDTSDITILTGELSFLDFRTANATLWNSTNIDNTTGLPYVFVTVDGWTPNPWGILESVAFLVAWQIFLIAIHVAAFIYTLAKFTLLVLANDFNFLCYFFYCQDQSIGIVCELLVFFSGSLCRPNPTYSSTNDLFGRNVRTPQ
jgi:hypothetical protein